MINKQIIQRHLENIIQLADKYEVQHELQDKISKLQHDIDHFALRILTVGAFSAGKSALLNTLLQKELLTENQIPETAIATELKYCPIETLEIELLNGAVEQKELTDKYTYSPEQVRNIRYNLDNEFLKKYPDMIFVDMPGFDSNVSQHNKAIMQYIAKGNAYLLVIDCEDGSIKSSTIDFINEIRQYEHNLIIAVTKSDKKPPSEVENVVKKVREQAEFIYGGEIPVVAVSKYEDSTVELISQLLESIDAQEVFHQICIPQVEQLYDFLLITVQQMANTNGFDSSTLDNEILKRQKLKEQLEEKLKSERLKLQRRMNNNVLPGIIGDVESTLYAHSMELAKAAMANSNAFSSRVNSLLRPVLIESTKRYTEQSYSEFIQELYLESMLVDQTEDIAQNISIKINQTIEVLKKIEQARETTEKLGTTYKTIAGVLAITTSAVAPWLELIIVFLPDILKLFGVGSKQGQMEKVRSSIENEVIPKIIEKLRPIIQESLEEMEQQLIEDLETKMYDLISIEEEALKSAQQMKQREFEKYEALQKRFKETVEFIKSQLNSIRGEKHGNE